ncbi:MAG: hypothetical protein ABR936_13585 [Bacteroidota bacterium]|jgi:hypothetical protein
MKDGTFKVFVEEGKTLGVFINSGLDSIYKSIFLKSRKALSEKHDDLELSIACIVFGCFWLEASCNAYIQNILEFRGTPRAKNLRGFDHAIQGIVTRANFLQKLDLLSTLASPSLHSRYQNLKQEAKKIFDLRNRLAHFKDNDEVIHRGPISEVKFIQLLRNLKEPKLIAMLRDVRKECESILLIGVWLDQIHHRWELTTGKQSHKIKVPKKKNMNDLVQVKLSKKPY